MRNALILVVLGACTPDETPESFIPETDVDTDEELVVETEPQAFVMKHVFSVLQTDPSPIGNSKKPLAITSYMTVSWLREGTEVTWEETLCGLSSNEIFGTTTTYPSALIDGVPLQVRTGTFASENVGATFEAGPFYDILGADLADPATSPLPQSGSDASALDMDGDGNPGVTVSVKHSLLGSGEAYVAQRLQHRLEGTMTDAGRVEGYVIANREQVVLDATTSWLKLAVKEEPDPDISHSFFILQEVEEGTSCSDLMADPSAFF